MTWALGMFLSVVLVSLVGGLIFSGSFRDYVAGVGIYIWYAVLWTIGRFFGGILPAWFVPIARWAWRKAVWILGTLATITVMATLGIVTAFANGHYHIAGIIFAICGILTLSLFLLWNKISRRIGLGSARMFGTLTLLLFFSSLVAFAMPNILQFLDRGQLLILGLALLGLSVFLTWWGFGRTFMALASIPLLFLALVPENNPMLKVTRSLIDRITTRTARKDVPIRTEAEMTLGTVIERAGLYVVTFTKDGQIGRAGRKTKPDDQTLVLEPGKIVKTWQARPDVQTALGEPTLEVVLPDDLGEFVLASERLFIPARKVKLHGPVQPGAASTTTASTQTQFPVSRPLSTVHWRVSAGQETETPLSVKKGDNLLADTHGADTVAGKIGTHEFTIGPGSTSITAQDEGKLVLDNSSGSVARVTVYYYGPNPIPPMSPAVASEQLLAMTVENYRNGPVVLKWVDAMGSEQKYATIASQTGFRQPTQANNVWIIRDLNTDVKLKNIRVTESMVLPVY